MVGRDILERHRTATPLELLFDLVFVVAFGTAAQQLAHAIAGDYIGPGIIGFAFATFAIAWAWINFTWFASAFDTDDWLFRLTTMVQMIGALILALGLPALFASLEEHTLDNEVMVLGYVVMRIPMIAQWLRAARQSPEYRDAAIMNAVGILVAQVGWVALLFAHTPLTVTIVCALFLYIVELGGPALAERRGGTPWHPHHIAERYGLMVIIALGEGMVGTMAALTAIPGPDGPGWSLDFVLIGFAGVALPFGVWWTYFSIPFAELLAAHRNRAFGFGYWHIVVFGAVVAMGAGFDIAAYFLEHETRVGDVATILSVLIPAGLYFAAIFLIYSLVTREFQIYHLVQFLISIALSVLVVVLVAGPVSVPWALLATAAIPWVWVVGYEVYGRRSGERIIAALPTE